MVGEKMATDVTAPQGVDYEEIEAAVLDTERGRWFLAEYARRNRNADTERLLAAIHQIEASIPATRPAAAPEEINGMRRAICEMAEEIENAKREIALITPQENGDKDISDATAELDAIVDSTERATSEILSAAEQIQELAWTLREMSAPTEFCDALDERATEIYTACSFQDITGQRTTKVVRVLQLLEARINAMAHLWAGASVSSPQPAEDQVREDDSHLLNGPALEGEGIDQDSIDKMMEEMEEMLEADIGVEDPAGAPLDGKIVEPRIEWDDELAGTDPEFGTDAEGIADPVTTGEVVEPPAELDDEAESASADAGASTVEDKQPLHEAAALTGLDEKDYEALFS